MLFAGAVNAQQISREKLDSLYTKYLQLRAPELLPETDQQVDLTIEDKKCGFGFASEIRLNLENFKTEQQTILKKILQRPNRQTSIVSPSGFFRIHYNTSGSEVPIYDPLLTTEENVEQVAIAIDSAFNFEVNYLGYPAPPPDNGEGGDNLYDIYITFAQGSYGFTEPEATLGDEKYTSFIEIHYSFANFFTKGLAAMRVTVAHELHHAIQVGNYILRLDDRYFYELTSTSMEEFVYDDVNDYYDYIKNYTNKTSRPFTRSAPGSLDGYDLAIWNIYLKENFEFDIIKEQWELMPTQRAINAISTTLLFTGSSFAREYNRFGIWTYYTGNRSIPGLYFKESENYPLVKPFANISFPQYNSAQVDAEATSNNFLKFLNVTTGDSLFAIITNGDVFNSTGEQLNTFNFQYTLFSDTISGERKLADEYSANFSSTSNTVWSVSEILNNIVVLENTIKKPPPGEITYAYPNPFNYKSFFLTEPLIFFPLNGEIGAAVDFNVFSSGMQLVYNGEKNIQILPGDQRGVSWNGLDNDNKKLASGVYIYIIKRGDDVETGKVVIFNE